MPTSRLWPLAAAVTVLLVGCQFAERAEPDAADESTDTAPAGTPASEAAADAAEVADPTTSGASEAPGPPPTLEDRLARRFAEIGPGNLLVVRAVIADLEAAERTLPQEIHSEPPRPIVTAMTLVVSRSYCGPSDELVRASYVGGRLPNGRTLRTDVMPRDLPERGEFVFVLRSAGGEYFLERGTQDLLQRNPSGGFSDFDWIPMNLDRLAPLCP